MRPDGAYIIIMVFGHSPIKHNLFANYVLKTGVRTGWLAHLLYFLFDLFAGFSGFDFSNHFTLTLFG